MVNVVVDEEREPRRSRRRDRGKRLVDAEDEGEEERGMSEPDRDKVRTLPMVPNTRPAARPPKTRRSSNSVWSTRGRSNRRRETQRIPMPGRIPRRNATKKSRFEAIVAEQAWGAT